MLDLNCLPNKEAVKAVQKESTSGQLLSCPDMLLLRRQIELPFTQAAEALN